MHHGWEAPRDRDIRQRPIPKSWDNKNGKTWSGKWRKFVTASFLCVWLNAWRSLKGKLQKRLDAMLPYCHAAVRTQRNNEKILVRLINVNCFCSLWQFFSTKFFNVNGKVVKFFFRSALLLCCSGRAAEGSPGTVVHFPFLLGNVEFADKGSPHNILQLSLIIAMAMVILVVRQQNRRPKIK